MNKARRFVIEIPLGKLEVYAKHDKSDCAEDYPGVFIPKVRHWMNLHEGDSLGLITDPIDGTVLQEVKSPCNGLVFTLREYPIVNPGSLVARVLAVSEPGKDKKGAAK